MVIANTSWYLYNFKLDIIKTFQNAGHTVVICAPFDDFSNKFEELGMEYVRLDFSTKDTGAKSNLKTLNMFMKYVKQVAPDKMVTFTIKPNIYGALAAKKLKISVLPTVTGLGSALIGGNVVKRYILKKMIKKAFRSVESVFFQNTEDEQFFVENGLIDKKQPKMIGSGVNLEDYNCNITQGEQVSFLMVARLLKDKGVIEYFEAAEMLKKKFSDTVSIKLIGPLWEDNPSAVSRESVDHYTRKGVIEYLGKLSIEEVKQEMSKASCVVLPSYKEGMSRTLLEAAALGRPLVATNVSGCREIVDEGVNGFLCKAKNGQSLFEAMEKIIELSREAREVLGKNSRSKIEREFNQDIINLRYLREVENEF